MASVEEMKKMYFRWLGSIFAAYMFGRVKVSFKGNWDAKPRTRNQ